MLLKGSILEVVPNGLTCVRVLKDGDVVVYVNQGEMTKVRFLLLK